MALLLGLSRRAAQAICRPLIPASRSTGTSIRSWSWASWCQVTAIATRIARASSVFARSASRRQLSAYTRYSTPVAIVPPPNPRSRTRQNDDGSRASARPWLAGPLGFALACCDQQSGNLPSGNVRPCQRLLMNICECRPIAAGLITVRPYPIAVRPYPGGREHSTNPGVGSVTNLTGTSNVRLSRPVQVPDSGGGGFGIRVRVTQKAFFSNLLGVTWEMRWIRPR